MAGWIETEYQGYFVNNKGEVKGPRGHKLSLVPRAGYYIVSISKADGKGGSFTVLVSRLVCQAFHGDPPSSQHWALHRNGDSSNNNPNNLYWGLPKQNSDDRERHGRTARGEKLGKLKNKQVIEIRKAFKSGESRASIAARYGISWNSVARIADGSGWTHIS